MRKIIKSHLNAPEMQQASTLEVLADGVGKMFEYIGINVW